MKISKFHKFWHRVNFKAHEKMSQKLKKRRDYIFVGLIRPLGCRMGLRSPNYFEQFFRSHFTANMFQNVTNVKLRSLTLILNLSFGQKSL